MAQRKQALKSPAKNLIKDKGISPAKVHGNSNIPSPIKKVEPEISKLIKAKKEVAPKVAPKKKPIVKCIKDDQDKSNIKESEMKTSKDSAKKCTNKTSDSKQPMTGTQITKELKELSDNSPKTYDMDSVDLDILYPDRISRFYDVPNEIFKTSDDVVAKYGYKILSKISEGGFAKVFKAQHLRTGIDVACKVVELAKKLPELKPRAAEARDMKNELYIMSLMNNRYIMRLYSHFVVNNNIFIFMKLANNGTLFGLIKDGGPAQEEECKYFMGQLLVGLEHMHEQSIAHKDLKLENILLTRDKTNALHILITDFGLSRIIRMKNDGNFELIKSFCGTPTYMAPEQLMNQEYDPFLSDVFSCGVMLFSMYNAAFPFDSSKRNVELMLKKQWAPWSKTVAPPSPMLLQVIDVTLEPDPSKRIRLSTLTRHPWIHNDYIIAKALCDPVSTP